MDEEIERLLVSVRADTGGFARDVAAMRAELDGPFAAGVARAGLALENALVRALRTGRLGFEDLKRVALSALAEIASASIRDGPRRACSAAARAAASAARSRGLVSGLIGAPGKAIGGPVSAGPRLSGRRARAGAVRADRERADRPGTGRGGAGRCGSASRSTRRRAAEARALAASSRQVARAVKAGAAAGGGLAPVRGNSPAQSWPGDSAMRNKVAGGWRPNRPRPSSGPITRMPSLGTPRSIIRLRIAFARPGSGAVDFGPRPRVVDERRDLDELIDQVADVAVELLREHVVGKDRVQAG